MLKWGGIIIKCYWKCNLVWASPFLAIRHKRVNKILDTYNFIRNKILNKFFHKWLLRILIRCLAVSHFLEDKNAPTLQNIYGCSRNQNEGTWQSLKVKINCFQYIFVPSYFFNMDIPYLLERASMLKRAPPFDVKYLMSASHE